MNLGLRDRIMFAVNPAQAARRLIERANGRVRAAGETSPQRSETRWRGASSLLRSLVHWTPTLGSGRSDLPKEERERLTARSYDAYRNHLLGRAVVTRFRTNVVGVGLIAHPDVDAEVLGISEEEADELNAIIANEWDLYAYNPAEIDIEGQRDFSGLQLLALTSSMLGGDCFGLTPAARTVNGVYDLKVQLIDAARISNPEGRRNDERLIDGIELSEQGRMERIYVRSRHPADDLFGRADWMPIEVHAPDGLRRVLHITCDRDQVGMVRAAPLLAPILEPLQVLEVLTRAELTASVVSALFTVFLKRPQPELKTNLPDPRGAAVVGQTTKENQQVLAMGAGAILDLDEGVDPVFANPTRPNAAVEPFMNAIITEIGAAVELPRDELMLAYQQSYSAARAAMLQASRAFTAKRWALTQQFCDPLRRIWFMEAVARGRIPVRDFGDPARRAAYMRAIWTGPARGAMDETREVAAAKARIDAGVSNETIETAQMMGEDWRGVILQRSRELRYREKKGVPVVAAPGAAPGAGSAAAQPHRPDGGRPIIQPGTVVPFDPQAPENDGADDGNEDTSP